MRIIAGKYKSLTIDIPRGNHVRPTADRIRENIFNIIDNRFGLNGECVIDLFSGSGALGFEALSRDARFCTFIDHDHRSCNMIKKNAGTLKINPDFFSIIKSDVLGFNYAAFKEPVKFIFADPPYNWFHFDKLIEKLNTIEAFSDTILIYECDKSYMLAHQDSLLDERFYGTTKISLFKLG